LNGAPATNDIATVTNADVLKKIVDVQLFTELTENMTELPLDWRQMVGSTEQVQRVGMNTEV
jgi:hypothetical protein